MSSKTKAKRFALGLALALALLATPQTQAGPAVGTDLGASVYAWLADFWTRVAGVADDEEVSGPMVIPNG